MFSKIMEGAKYTFNSNRKCFFAFWKFRMKCKHQNNYNERKEHPVILLIEDISHIKISTICFGTDKSVAWQLVLTFCGLSLTDFVLIGSTWEEKLLKNGSASKE